MRAVLRQPENAGWRRRAALATACGSLVVGGCSAAEFIDHGDTKGSQVQDIPGCGLPALPPPREEQQPSVIRRAYPEVPRYPTNVDWAGVAAQEIITQAAEFELVSAQTIEASGVELDVYSYDRLAVDQAAMEELFNVVFELQVPSVRLQAALECYRERLNEDKEFSGAKIQIFIPGDGSRCLQNLSFAERQPAQTYAQACDASGFAPPVHELGQAHNQTFGEFISLKLRSYPIIIAPGQIDKETAEIRAAQLFVHELQHVFDAMFEVPTIWKSNERKVLYLESEINNYYKGRGRPPRPFRYASETTGSSASP